MIPGKSRRSGPAERLGRLRVKQADSRRSEIVRGHGAPGHRLRRSALADDAAGADVGKAEWSREEAEHRDREDHRFQATQDEGAAHRRREFLACRRHSNVRANDHDRYGGHERKQHQSEVDARQQLTRAEDAEQHAVSRATASHHSMQRP